MLDEERLLKRFEPACQRYINNIFLPGMDQSDLMQEAKLAALGAIRSFDPAKGKGKLTTHVIAGIRWRIANLMRHSSMQMRDKEAEVCSLDAFADNDYESDTVADRIPAKDNRSAHDLLLACLQLCETATERAIIASTWDGQSMAELGREIGLSRERMRQLKERLMVRIREGVMGA
jgi:RNA polymerase sigma factor (sigma-70 family)